MKNLTDREQNIVLATIRLWNVNSKSGYVPDYELIEPSFDLPTEVKRDIRDLVQDVRPANDQAETSEMSEWRMNERIDDSAPASCSACASLRKRIADLEQGMKEIAHWSQEDQDDPQTCAMQWRGCAAIARGLLKPNMEIARNQHKEAGQ